MMTKTKADSTQLYLDEGSQSTPSSHVLAGTSGASQAACPVPSFLPKDLHGISPTVMTDTFVPRKYNGLPFNLSSSLFT